MTLSPLPRSRVSKKPSAIQPLGAVGGVDVLADPFDLGFEGVDDRGVDAGVVDPGDGFSVVGEVFGQANGGLLVVSGPSDFCEPFTLPR